MSTGSYDLWGFNMEDARERVISLENQFSLETDRIATGGPATVDNLAALPVLDAWAGCLEWARSAGLSDHALDSVAQAATEAVDAYTFYQQSSGHSKANQLSAMQAHLDVFPPLWDARSSEDGSRDWIERLRHRIESARRESSQLMGVVIYISEKTSDLDRAVRGVKEAEHNALSAVALAQKAATDAATSKLEASFEITAARNYRAAFWFRLSTISVLALVIVLAIVFALTHAPTAGESVDWYGIVYRVAVLSALGALGAYLGRQAGNYSRLATWAHGIQIQLKAFLGFVNEIEDGEARQTMFTLFGKRVLESPPDGRSSTDDAATNVIQPIFEQAAKLRPPQ